MAKATFFEEWRAELESTLHSIQVLSNPKNLEYFMSTNLMNRPMGEIVFLFFLILGLFLYYFIFTVWFSTSAFCSQLSPAASAAA